MGGGRAEAGVAAYCDGRETGYHRPADIQILSKCGKPCPGGTKCDLLVRGYYSCVGAPRSMLCETHGHEIYSFMYTHTPGCCPDLPAFYREPTTKSSTSR